MGYGGLIMGYYTNYELHYDTAMEDADGQLIDHEGRISKVADYGSCFEESIKWYDHEKDMKEYSTHYPDILFTLMGDGEESGDIWCCYFKNGKMQRAETTIAFTPFDSSKLK
jgi:hypothetical protein